jgi:hypothetical protein
VVNCAVTHSGDPRLARHIGNATVRTTDNRGTRIYKEHKHSSRRIDLAVCAIMAHSVAATVSRCSCTGLRRRQEASTYGDGLTTQSAGEVNASAKVGYQGQANWPTQENHIVPSLVRMISASTGPNWPRPGVP